MRTLAALATALSLVAACGGNNVSSPLERGAVGAGLGLGVGAAGAAVTGVDPVTGAVVGATAGALIGAATSKRYNK